MKPILPWANSRTELRSYGISSMLKQNDASQAAAVPACLIADWYSQSPGTSSQMLTLGRGMWGLDTAHVVAPPTPTPQAYFLFPPRFVTLIFNWSH